MYLTAKDGPTSHFGDGSAKSCMVSELLAAEFCKPEGDAVCPQCARGKVREERGKNGKSKKERGKKDKSKKGAKMVKLRKREENMAKARKKEAKKRKARKGQNGKSKRERSKNSKSKRERGKTAKARDKGTTSCQKAQMANGFLALLLTKGVLF